MRDPPESGILVWSKISIGVYVRAVKIL